MHKYTLFFFGCISTHLPQLLKGTIACSSLDHNNGTNVVNDTNSTNGTNNTSPWNAFIEEFKNMENFGEKIEALKKFALRQEAEKERTINEIIKTKEAEKEKAVEAMKKKMAYGTLFCSMTYINAVIEHVYRDEVEKFNASSGRKAGDRQPIKANAKDELNKKIGPHYDKWVEFLQADQPENDLWSNIHKRIPDEWRLLEFAWSMPKIYLFCKDYMHGRRAESLKHYKRLKLSGKKKSFPEFILEHSVWTFLKTDLDYVNVLLEAVGFDVVGYEWLDKEKNLVVPLSLAENCWPSDKYFYTRRSFDHVMEKSPADEELELF